MTVHINVFYIEHFINVLRDSRIVGKREQRWKNGSRKQFLDIGFVP